MRKKAWKIYGTPPNKGSHISGELKGQSRRERARTRFFQDLFKYACSLLEERKTTEQELERQTTWITRLCILPT